MTKTQINNQKTIWLSLLQKALAITILFLFFFEIIRPLTNFPNPVPDSNEPGVKSIQDIFGKFFAKFAFFTTWTNILIVLPIAGDWLFKIKVNPYLKNVIGSYSILIMIIFFALIAPFIKWNTGIWGNFVKIYEHLFIVFIALYWFFTTKNEKEIIIKKSLAITAFTPTVYLILAVFLYVGSSFIAFPYSFLNFKNTLFMNLPMALSVIVSIVIIGFIIFIVLGSNVLLIKLDKKFNGAVVVSNEKRSPKSK